MEADQRITGGTRPPRASGKGADYWLAQLRR